MTQQRTASIDPTEQAIVRVSGTLPRGQNSRAFALRYIARLAPNLICLDCGSENHTRGNPLCTAPENGSSREGGDA